MRKAFYYDSVIPPKKWLIYASLLWHKINASPYALLAVQYLSKSNEDLDFLKKLNENSNIIEFEYPELRNDLTKTDIIELQNHKKKVWDKLNEIANILGIENNDNDGEHYLESNNKEAMIEFVKNLNSLDWPFLNLKLNIVDRINIMEFFDRDFYCVISDTDLFFNNESPMYNSIMKSRCFLLCTEAIAPIRIASISISQILDFRERNRITREKYKKEADKIIDEFLQNCSTEEDFKNRLKLCEDFIKDQIQDLEIDFRNTKIEIIKKTMAITFAGPALLNALASSLDIAFFQPAAIISALSLAASDILLSIQKGRKHISKSPWGYLFNMKKL